MPTIGSALIQPQSGVVSFPKTSSLSTALTGFTLQTPSQGINLFEAFASNNGAITLGLRSVAAGSGIKLVPTNGIIYISVDTSTLSFVTDSPTFTGEPKAPTAAAGNRSLQIANTEFVAANFMAIGSSVLTGTPLAPTAAAGTHTDQIATTKFVHDSYAPLDGPIFIGIPTAPTASPGDASNQLATDAFVQTATGGVTRLDFTGQSGSRTLTAAQYGNKTIILTGTPQAGVTVVFPAIGHWVVVNRTSTVNTISLTTVGGTPLLIPQDSSMEIIADGTDVVPAIRYITQYSGDISTNVATTQFVQNLIGTGGSSITTINTSGNNPITLDPPQYGNRIIVVTGPDTNNATLIVPNRGFWLVFNRFTSHRVTVKTAGGSGASIDVGYSALVVADGVNVVFGHTEYNAINLLGNCLAVTQTVSDNSTRLATTGYVKSQFNNLTVSTLSLTKAASPTLTLTNTGTGLAVNGAVIGTAILGADKGQPLGYAPLDIRGQVPSANLPVMAQNITLPFFFGSLASAQIYNQVLPIVCTLPANFKNTVVYASTPATSNTVFTVNKISSGAITTIGTITITAASNTGRTLSTQPAIGFVAGDVVQLVAPVSPDATLANVAITFLATTALPDISLSLAVQATGAVGAVTSRVADTIGALLTSAQVGSLKSTFTQSLTGVAGVGQTRSMSVGWLVLDKTFATGQVSLPTVTSSTPSLDLSLTGPVLDSRIVFSRAAGPATYLDATGVLQTSGYNLILNSVAYAPTSSGATITVSSDLPPLFVGSTIYKHVVTGAPARGVTTISGLTPSTQYIASFYAYVPVGDPSTSLYNSIGEGATGVIGARTDYNFTQIGTWQRLTAIYTTGPAESAINPMFIRGNPSLSGTFYTTALQLERGNAANSYAPTSGAASGAPRFDYDVWTNQIRNSVLAGAVVGTPGTLPTNVVVPTPLNGLSYSVVAFGTTSGLPYFDLRINGTTTGAGVATNLSLESITQIAALNGQKWTTSLYYALVGGTLTNVGGISLGTAVYSSTSTYLAESPVARTILSPTVTLTRSISIGTIVSATAASIQPYLQLTYAGGGGVVIDLTLRIAAPQVELGTTAHPFVSTFGTSAIGATSRGLLIEEVRTNSIRNSTMANTGGIPTNWSSETDSATGVTSSYTYGTENGIAYVDWRVNGTPTSSTYYMLFFDSLSAKNIAFVPSIVWTSSAYVKLAAGSLTNVTSVRVGLRISDSVPTAIASLFTVCTPTIAPLVSQRIAASGTSANGAAAFITSFLQVSYTTGVPIDFTLRIGLPQLEIGSFATSAIPTSGTGATRAADVTNMLVGPWFNAAQGVLVVDAMVPSAASSQVGLVSLDNGTVANRTTLRLTAPNSLQAVYVAASATTVTDNAGTMVVGVPFKLAASMLPTSLSTSLDGAAVVTGTGTAPTGLTTLRLGQNGVASGIMSGYVSRVRYWPRAMPDADLRVVTLDPTAPSLNLDLSASLDPRITFSRASGPATYFDATGVMQTASTNLYLRSGQIEQAPWIPTGTTITTGTYAPDGSTNGVFVQEDTASGGHSVQQTITITIGVPWTVSVYAKAKERSIVCIVGLGLTSVGVTPRFDTATGADVTFGSNPNCTHGIQNAGNGWYRCWVTFIATTTGTPNIFIHDNNGYVGGGTWGMYLWGAQAEQSALLSDYTPTTTVPSGAPRFDYDPITHAARGLLIEETRTNYALQSGNMSIAPWTVGRTTLTGAAALAPDGTMAATRVVEDTTATSSHYMGVANLTVLANAPVTMSVYLHDLTRRFGALVLYDNTTPVNDVFVNFDLVTGTITATGAAGAATAASALITNVGGGWYRVSLTGTLSAAATTGVIFRVSLATAMNMTSTNYTGDGVSGFYVWGAQIEAGAFATSYIPTLGTSLIRPADAATMPVNVAWFNPAAGTFAADVLTQTVPPAGSQTGFLRVDDGTSINLLGLWQSTSNQCFGYGSIGSVIQFNNAIGPALDAATRKTAITYGAAWLGVGNGGTIVTGSGSAGPFSASTMRLGTTNLSDTYKLNGCFQRLRYWPRALSPAELQTATTFDPNPSLNLDLTNALDSRISFSRSAGPATYFDTAGVLQTAGYNYIRNNTMVGAIAGSPGTSPTNWTISGTGLTRTLTFSTVDGMSVIDMRFAGTASAVFCNSTFDGNNVIAATNGQTWTQSAYIALIAGSLANVNNLTLTMGQYTSVPAFLSNLSGSDIKGTISSTLQRFSAVFTTNNASTAFVQPTILVNYPNGTVVDFTLRIAMPQLELGSVATAPIVTSGTASGAPRFDFDPVTHAARGLLVEDGRTNSIRNSTMVGAISGTPGTPPTNWGMVGSLGIAIDVVGTGTETGIPCIDLRFYGTASSNGGIRLAFEILTQVAASVGQTWTHSISQRLLAGTAPSTLIVEIREYAAGVGGTINANVSVLPTTSALNSQRISFTKVLVDAGTTTVQPTIRLGVIAAVVYDFTLRIGGPQLEQGPFASTYIPTTTAQVGRPTDVCTMPVGPWFNPTQGTLAIEGAMRQFNIPAMTIEIGGFDDGTSNNIYAVRNGATTFMNAAAVTANVLQTRQAVTANSFVAGESFKAAMTYDAGTVAAVLNGGTVSQGNVGNTPPIGLNRLNLNALRANSQNGTKLRIRYWPRVLSAAELQAITV